MIGKLMIALSSCVCLPQTTIRICLEIFQQPVPARSHHAKADSSCRLVPGPPFRPVYSRPTLDAAHQGRCRPTAQSGGSGCPRSARRRRGRETKPRQACRHGSSRPEAAEATGAGGGLRCAVVPSAYRLSQHWARPAEEGFRSGEGEGRCRGRARATGEPGLLISGYHTTTSPTP